MSCCHHVSKLTQYEVIAGHYKFSPRLLGLMGCDPLKPKPVITEPPRTSFRDMWYHPKDRKEVQRYQSVQGRKALVPNADPEKAGDSSSVSSNEAKTLDLNHYNLINEVWYYCSVDRGPRCEQHACSFQSSLTKI